MTPRNLPERPAHAPRLSFRLLILALSVSSLLGRATPARAWGRLGHRAAGRHAEARLTPAARSAVRNLLEPGETLADASTWADEVRREIPESGPWHYVNVPITEPRYDARFCPEEGCVVGKIGDFRRVLADPKAPRGERRKALRFLAHLIEDLHQPVHVGHRDDRGGNNLQVRFFDQGSNLHRVWDSGLLERAFPDEAKLTADLDALIETKTDVRRWAGGTVEDWANESLEAARKAYQVPGAGRPLRRGEKLSSAYMDANLPVARERLARSAVRLAAVLNAVFAGAP